MKIMELQMEKIKPHRLRSALILAIILFPVAGILSAQKTGGNFYPIPENVNEIFRTSCTKCHGKEGGRFPKTRLNLSKWQTYGPEKEVEKAILICNTLKRGSMPPKSAREKGSVAIPTREQIEIVCQWAQSLKQQPHRK